jgi:alpha-glucosidase
MLLLQLLPALVGCDGGRFGDVFFETGFRRFDTGDTGSAGLVELASDGLGFTTYCAEIPLTVTAVDDGVVRLAYDFDADRTSYAVLPAEEEPEAPSIVVYTDIVALRTAALLVLVDRDSCAVTVEDADGHELVADAPGGAYAYGGGAPSLVRTLADGEHIYGLGERTGGLDRRGSSYTCWNTDAYDATDGGWSPDADPLYQCVPFYVSLRDGIATGVFTDITYRSTFDVGAGDPEALAIAADGGPMDQYIVAGPSFAEVLDRYTRLTGRPPLPPRWSLGFHQSRWGWEDAAAVTDVADGFRARGLPLDAVWLDIQHMDGFRSWTWDPATFPDPAALVGALAADGVHTVTIVDPGIKVDPGWAPYDEGLAGDYFLTDAGEPWVGTVWPGDAVFPDFTSAEVRSWWGGLAATDVGYGVAGVWLDMNEPADLTLGTVPNSLVANGNGDGTTTMEKVHNVYALEEAAATFDGLLSAAPDHRPFLLTRAGFAGIQRYAATWTGDAPSTWDTLSGTLPMLLGMGLSGEPWVGSDVGGYSGGATAELYARWMQLGGLSPFFRAHLTEGVADQYPWSFGTEVEDISRDVLDLRSSLLPYLYSLALAASTTGAPPLRPLVWDYPLDANVADLGDEALLGPWLLVAPITTESATSRDVYLPAGRWFELATGAITDGPATVTVADVPLGALPVYVRAGAIVPRGPVMASTDAAPVDPLTLEVYPTADATTFTVYEDAGDGFDYATGAYSAVTWTLQGTSTGATLTASERDGSFVPDARTLRVRVRRVDVEPTEVRRDGTALTAWPTEAALLAAGTGWWWDTADLSLWIVIPDGAAMSLEMDYDPTVSELAPAVAMPFRVTLPADTPADTAICIASSADDWATQTPLTRDGDTAYGTLTVPRGAWLRYKYTRGGWDTVEKWPACEEATNRYELGRATPVKEDTVYGWADWCP